MLENSQIRTVAQVSSELTGQARDEETWIEWLTCQVASRLRFQIPARIPPSSTLLPEKYKKNDEFWLADSNVILAVSIPGSFFRRLMAFRMYRRLISNQSGIFGDMFSSSNPSPDESLDGCPIIRLSDSAEDLTYFLRVLLPSTQRL